MILIDITSPDIIPSSSPYPPSQGLKKALLDLFVEHLNEAKIDEIIEMLQLRNCVDGTTLKDNAVDLNIDDFCSVVAFTERYICPRVELVSLQCYCHKWCVAWWMAVLFEFWHILLSMVDCIVCISVFQEMYDRIGPVLSCYT